MSLHEDLLRLLVVGNNDPLKFDLYWKFCTKHVQLSKNKPYRTQLGMTKILCDVIVLLQKQSADESEYPT